MGDTCLDDDIGLQVPDDLLIAHEIFRQLDDRNAKPGERITVLLIPTDGGPDIRERFEGGIRVERIGVCVDVQRLGLGVYRDLHCRVLYQFRHSPCCISVFDGNQLCCRAGLSNKRCNLVQIVRVHDDDRCWRSCKRLCRR